MEAHRWTSGSLRFLKLGLAMLLATLLGGASVRSEAGADLARLLKDYRDGAGSLNAAIDPERGNGPAAAAYDAETIAKFLTARRQLNQNLSGRLLGIAKAQLSPSDRKTKRPNSSPALPNVSGCCRSINSTAAISASPARCSGAPTRRSPSPRITTAQSRA